jgi:nicotinamidase/pyrazinamidase
MNENRAFVDVDTQEDFMLPSGRLYVPGAEQIIPNLKKLMDYARERGIPVLSSADAHPPDDPSFAEWPPHCVVGTPGQRRIPETQWGSTVIVANRRGAFTPPRKWAGQTIIEKTEYDFSTNPNFDAILSSLRGSFGNPRFVVFGVATEYCVRGAVLALRKRGLPVDLVTDAIRGISSEGERKAVEEMVAAGVRLVKTEEVCAPARQEASR